MAWSKLFELVDTAFLVLRKKPVLVLHWVHHITVLLFTWYCQVAARTHAPLMYTLMNAVVHSLMYTYYAFAAVRVFFPYPQLLTVLQLVQMVIGAAVAVHSGYCASPAEDSTLFWTGVVMYATYFGLFLNFFVARYFGKPKPVVVSKEAPDSPERLT
jgi:elongation of very long chain fatty acids protein 6